MSVSWAVVAFFNGSEKFRDERARQMQSVKYFTRKEASEYLRAVWGLQRSIAYLAKLAVVGGGPAFHKANRAPLYTVKDLDAWASALIGPRVHSTSEANGKPRGRHEEI